MARQCAGRHSTAWHGTAWRDELWCGTTAWYGMTQPGTAQDSVARHSQIQHGIAWHSVARHRRAWHGQAQCSVPGLGTAWHGQGQRGMAHPCKAQDGTAPQSTGTLGTLCLITRWQGLAALGQGCPGATRCPSPGGGGAAAGRPGAAPPLGAGGGCPNGARCHLEDPDCPSTLQRAEPCRTR